MEIRQLELFLAVMDTGSVTRAAERVYLSPGAVSMQLHQLATDLRVELFVRSGRRFLPTPAAERLAERAREVLKRIGLESVVTEDDMESRGVEADGGFQTE